jgi:hypothetical protein
MLNVLFDDVAVILTRIELNLPIFNIAFADFSSNAKNSPLITLSFAILLGLYHTLDMY